MVLNSLKLLLCTVVLWGVSAHAVAPGSADEIRERTTPVGELCRVGENCAGVINASSTSAIGAVAAGGAMSGEQIYNQFCFACHATGVTEAPRFGNADDWAPRIAKGIDTLMETTLAGLKFMPPKGACMACSDEELRAAVDYMVETAQ